MPFFYSCARALPRWGKPAAMWLWNDKSEIGVMRSGPNSRRLRGRGNNNRRGGGNAPRNQNFESNGPDVKVRGNAQQVVEKYLQLARDAATAGDPVMAENYYQHAEHYYRIQVAQADRAAQRQQEQQQRNGNANGAEDGDEDDENEAVEAQVQHNGNGAANGADDADDGDDEPVEEERPRRPSRSQRAKSAPAAAVEAAMEASRDNTGDQPG
jgi:hypothetical protein